MSEFRLKYLSKLAQSDPNLPTEEVAKTQTVSGSPQNFIPSDLYPGIIIAYTSKNLPAINGLANVINLALYYSSNGQISLMSMKSSNFNIGTTNVPSQSLKNLMNFCKILYNQLFTDSGAEYKNKLTPEQIQEKITNLKNNQFLQNLPSTNPMGQLGTKLGGNLKTEIINYLSNIK